MRHRIKGRKLNRTTSHKKALIRNLANQLFEHKEIKTTTAKAKEARLTVERLITYAKKGDTHHRRLAFSFLRQKETIKTLFDEIAPTFTERQGGYTRVIKLGRRQGDGAPMAILQLVGFETLGDAGKQEKKKKQKKKEEKSAEKEAKSVEKNVPVVAEADTEEAEKASEEIKKEVDEKNATDTKPVEKRDEEEKEPAIESEQLEEIKSSDESQEVKEETPQEEAKTDDSETDEEKKEE
jgi:large subunit ribosomal protein L17